MTAVRIAPLVAILTLGLGGCFDEPIRESLTLEFGARDTLAIEVRTHLATPTREESTVEVRARLEEERRRLASGEDDWTARFGDLSAQRDDVTHSRTAGVLTAVIRRAELDLERDPEALRRFFSDTLVAATWRATPEGRELFLEPLAPGRASYRDRQRLARRLEGWTEAVASYLTSASELFQYLERNPERRRPVFGVVLDDALVEADRTDEDGLLDVEKPLVDALGDAMGEVLEVLTVEAGEAYSLNEISRLVYDPFPAPLRVVLPAAPSSVEGFVPAGSERQWRVPERSLWQALGHLTAPRLAPDPLALLVATEADLSGGGPPAEPRPFDELVGDELRYPVAADALELRREVEQELAGEPVYRLAWR